MVKKYRVWPAEEEQQELWTPASRGRAAAYRRTHARILLLCDEYQPGGAMKDDGMARSPRAGSARRNGCAAWRGGGSGAGPGAKAAGQPLSEEPGQSGRAPPDWPGLFRTAGGPGWLDAATTGGPVRAEEGGGERQYRPGAPDAERALAHPAPGGRRIRLRRRMQADGQRQPGRQGHSRKRIPHRTGVVTSR